MISQSAPTTGNGNRPRRWLWLAAFWLAIGPWSYGPAVAQQTEAAAPAAVADEAALGQEWVRLDYDENGKLLGMQTAVVRYTGAVEEGGAAVEVDLIGAVHIGDAAYYERLNDKFEQYDVLLYELVAPEGHVVAPGRGTSSLHPIGAVQNAMKRMLDLEHQLEVIDYTRPNFVHADMTPAEFAQAMRDRNESFLQMYFRLLGQAMAQQTEMNARGQSLEVDLLSALFAKDRPRRLKTALAKQLAEMESLMVSFGGEQGSVIITERNKKALEVLREQLAGGRNRVGIFYGAGHLNDMDQRLREEFNMRPVAVRWLTAWDLTP